MLRKFLPFSPPKLVKNITTLTKMCFHYWTKIINWKQALSNKSKVWLSRFLLPKTNSTHQKLFKHGHILIWGGYEYLSFCLFFPKVFGLLLICFWILLQATMWIAADPFAIFSSSVEWRSRWRYIETSQALFQSSFWYYTNGGIIRQIFNGIHRYLYYSWKKVVISIAYSICSIIW